MAEYIERKAAVKYVTEKAREVLLMSGFDFPVRVYYKMAVAHAVEDLKFMPSADVVEVRHGEWLPQRLLGEDVWDCSECKTLGSPLWERCPICGSKNVRKG